MFSILFASLFTLASAAGLVDLSPAKVELSMTAGETRVQEFTLRNNTDTALRVVVEFEDFTSGGNEAVKLLGAERGPYSLVDRLSVELPDFILAPGQSQVVPINVTLPADLASGAYYASVLFALSQPTSEPVEVSSRLGALMFVRVAGEIEESGELREFAVDGGEFSLLYGNTGDIYLSPYGFVAVENLFGREVGFVEIEPFFVLPGSLRRLTLPLPTEVGMFDTVLLKLNRGYGDVVDERADRRVGPILLVVVIALIAVWLVARIFLKLKQ